MKIEVNYLQKIFSLELVSGLLDMTHNGPAIWGDCVTRSCPDRIEDPDRSVRSVWGKHRAVSRFFSREIVTVQEFNCGQMRALPTEAELGEAKSRHGGAKSVTNNLPILSVLAERYFLVHQPDHILKTFSFIILAVWTISLISDGNCSFCHFLSVSIDLSAFLTAFKAYNAASNE
jgi:hypothetical protein